MKKWIIPVLVLAMSLSLCACAAGVKNTAATEPKLEGLCVGYGKKSITPEGSVPLAGYSNALDRMSTGVRDEIYATCIAITQGEDTVLLFSVDMIGADEPACSNTRSVISMATGVPVKRIIIAGTHTHSGPALTVSDPSVDTYMGQYVEAMVNCAKEALADRSSAVIYGADVEVEGLNFVRHYKMSDGSVKSANTNDFVGSEAVDYAMEIDNEMVLVKFDRKDETKKDILLMNWQAHPCYNSAGGTSTEISADYIGCVRDAVEQQTDLNFIYLVGGSGNQTTSTYLKEDDHHLDVKGYGEALASAAITALPGLQKIEGEGIKTSQVKFEYATNRADLDKIEDAKAVVKAWKEDGKIHGDRKALELGFNSIYHANAIVNRASYPATSAMEFNALYVAGMALITAPYEMFSNASIPIKEGSPFDITVVCSMANGRFSYVPCAEAFDYDAYEAVTSYFARGCSEAAADKFAEMLKGLQ